MYKQSYYIFYLLFALISIELNAQNIRDRYYFDKLPIYLISAQQNNNLTKPPLPFDSIIIYDARADTSFLGFVNERPKGIFKISLEAPVNNFFKNYILDNYTLGQKKDSCHSLFVLIKKLMLTEFIPDSDNLDPSQISWNAGVVFEAEFFGGVNASYKTLYRIDTLLTIDDKLHKNEMGILQATIQFSLDRLSNKSLAEIKTGKKNFTIENIASYASNIYNYPITNDTLLKKGVYMSFAEFKNNTPSFSEYEIKKDSKTDALYRKENGEMTLVRNCWGYCDGVNPYIKCGENYFALFQYGRGFYFKGFKELKKHRYLKPAHLITLGLTATLLSNHGKEVYYKGDLTALQLDIESGDAY
jgi:hypothetical protein